MRFKRKKSKTKKIYCTHELNEVTKKAFKKTQSQKGKRKR